MDSKKEKSFFLDINSIKQHLLLSSPKTCVYKQQMVNYLTSLSDFSNNSDQTRVVVEETQRNLASKY